MEANSSLHQKLATSRKDLLDLTTRNRLLSTPVERSRTTALEIVDEESEAVFSSLMPPVDSTDTIASSYASRPSRAPA